MIINKKVIETFEKQEKTNGQFHWAVNKKKKNNVKFTEIIFLLLPHYYYYSVLFWIVCLCVLSLCVCLSGKIKLMMMMMKIGLVYDVCESNHHLYCGESWKLFFVVYFFFIFIYWRIFFLPFTLHTQTQN